MKQLLVLLAALGVASLASCGGTPVGAGGEDAGGGGGGGGGGGAQDAGGNDAGNTQQDAGQDAGGNPGGDAGVDGGQADAGGEQDAGNTQQDAGNDAGNTQQDAGNDAGTQDAGNDAGTQDAGSGPDAGPDAGVRLPDGGTPVAPNQVCQLTAERQCDYRIRCGEPALLFVTGGGGKIAPSERAKCVAEGANDPQCTVQQQGVLNGRVRFDAVGYDLCLNAFNPAGTCNRDIAYATSKFCRNLEFFAPNTDAGQLCTNDLECKNGFCTVTNGTACGTCQTWGAPTAACTRDRMCNPDGGYCPSSDGGASTCVAYTALGSACNVANLDQALEECGTNNQCVLAFAPLPPSVRCGVGKALGATCGRDFFECGRTQRGFETTCSVPGAASTGTCVPFQALPGGACETGDNIPGLGQLLPICPDEQYCVNKTCVARPTTGQACPGGNECSPGLVCDGGTCGALKTLGVACGAATDCQELLSCDGGTCQPTLALVGQRCGDTPAQGAQCAGSYCAGSITRTCTARQGTAGTCTDNNQCQSFTCTGVGARICTGGCWQ